MRIRLEDGTEADARIRGKKLKPVCGDEVIAEPISEEADWLITAIRERRNALDRPNARGDREVLAANVGLLLVVAAVTPNPDWFVVDRYLCAAELMPVAAGVVFNKTDLAVPRAVQRALGVYAAAGYQTIRTSAASGAGMDELQRLIGDRTAIFVGQSGTGKSSIINRLSDMSAQKTAAISRKHREGRHTTVNSVMFPLPRGGSVIDSPGVRDYAPVFRNADEPRRGFREVAEFGRHCRFSNCRHLREPGCAVKGAVDSERIDARRYESYRRALALADRLNRDRY